LGSGTGKEVDAAVTREREKIVVAKGTLESGVDAALCHRTPKIFIVSGELCDNITEKCPQKQ
jgi:hypothetical protein